MSREVPVPGRRWPVIALIVLAIAALAVGINHTANVAAADRMAAACIRLRTARTTWWTQNEAVFTRLLEDDLPFVREMFDELGEEPCSQVEARLRSPLTIGFVETWQGEPWPEARMNTLREVSERAETRCLPLMREVLGEVASLGEGMPEAELETAARDACGDMNDSLERFVASDRESSEPIALTAWPREIEALTHALESVVGGP